MIIVFGVEMFCDLVYVKVYVIFFNDKDEVVVKVGIKVLQEVFGFICFLLGKVMCLCIVLELIFFYDNLLVEGMCMFNLVISVVKYDDECCVNLDDSKED